MRKMVLLFNKMSFGQILHLLSLLKAYLHAANVYSNAHLDVELNGYTYTYYCVKYLSCHKCNYRVYVMKISTLFKPACVML